MQTTTYKLNVTPGGVPLTIHISQYDVGLRQYTFQPYTSDGEFTYVSGATVTLEATKPDGYATIHNCTYNQDGSITYTVQAQLAAVPGRVWSKVVIRNGNNILGTGAVVWMVDNAGVKDNAIVSDSDISALQQWMANVEDYSEAAASSASLAESAVTSAQAAATQAAGYVDQAVILGGTPLVASTVSAMTNHDRVYVYTGSETGYTSGNWYYWNGSAWTSGGIYNSSAVQTDPTLSVSGMAADAAATGELKNELNSFTVAGKNLYNPLGNVRAGCYVYYLNGELSNLATYSSVGIPVVGGRSISLNNAKDAHISFFSSITLLSEVPNSTAISGYISGVTIQHSQDIGENISVPDTAKMVVISLKNAQFSGLQVEYGSTCTDYEPYETLVDGEHLLDLSVTEEKLSNDLPKKTTGKNKLNKNTSNKLSGKYVEYDTGKVSNNAEFTAIAIPVEGGKTVSVNVNWGHYSFYSEYTDISGISTGSNIPNYISGIAGTSSYLTGGAIPASAKMMVVAFRTSFLNTAQVEYGSSCTAYEPYVYGYDGSIILPRSIPKDRISDSSESVYLLKADGTGDFANLRACFDAINALDYYDHVTVNLEPGTYDIRACYTDNEWNASGFLGLIVPHDVSLVGINGTKGNTVITCTSATPMDNVSALNFTNNIECENITFYGENLRYVIHDDRSDYNSANEYGDYRRIKNCDFIGSGLTYGFVYGAGTVGGSQKEFDRVRFINKTDYHLFSTHDRTDGASKLSETHIFKNCEFIAKKSGQNNVRLCPAISGVNQTVIFIGCKLKNLYVCSQYTGGDNTTTVYNVLGTGNSKDITYSYYNDHDKLSAPRFTDSVQAGINISGATLNVGDYCKDTVNGVTTGTVSDHDGIVVIGSANNGVVYFAPSSN